MHPTSTRHTAPLTGSASSAAPARHEDTFPMDYLDEADFVLPADGPAHGADLEERVQNTQQRLAQLRQEAEALEQEKLRFEELSRQQKEFMQGRAEMGDKFTRALSHLDRETYEAQRRVEQLLVIKESFNHQLDIIDSLNPEQWNPQDLRHDLARALAMIDEAREEYVKGSGRIHLLTAGGSTQASGALPGPAASQNQSSAPAPAGGLIPVNGSASGTPGSLGLGASLPAGMTRETFRFWLFCGLGFTVPLAATALLIFLGWLIFR